jgi:hypothetical protein
MKHIKSVFPAAFILAFFVLLYSCSKGGSTPTPPTPPVEENLKISTTASTLNITPGAEYDFSVSVDSKMPTDGVKIEYTLKGETDNQDYPQGPAIDTKIAKTDIRLSGVPRQKFCVCNITVTSKTKPANTTTTSFRVVYK